MKAVFVYRYLTHGGGCEAVMKARLAGLPGYGVDAHAWFLFDLGGRGMFAGLEARAHVGPAEGLRAFLGRFRPDVVTTIDTPEVFSLLAPDTVPPVLILESHSTYWDGLAFLEHLAALPIARVIAPSRAQAEALAARCEIRCPVSVVPNPVCEEFLAEPVGGAAAPRRPCVGWIGRLDELKNWRMALEIMSAPATTEPDAELWLAGRAVEPPVEEELRRAAARLGVLPRLRWFRGLPFAAIPAFLDIVRDSGGVLLSTSTAESFGLAVAEGMARGCTVVVPDLPAFQELVADGATGILYRGGDAGAGADAVAGALADAALRSALGRSARASVVERLSPAAALPVLAKVLRAAFSG